MDHAHPVITLPAQVIIVELSQPQLPRMAGRAGDSARLHGGVADRTLPHPAQAIWSAGYTWCAVRAVHGLHHRVRGADDRGHRFPRSGHGVATTVERPRTDRLGRR